MASNLSFPKSASPNNWRNLPDDKGNERDLENDPTDLPTPQYVIDMIGFDPDDEEDLIGNEDVENFFCPTGVGGGRDPSCSGKPGGPRMGPDKGGGGGGGRKPTAEINKAMEEYAKHAAVAAEFNKTGRGWAKAKAAIEEMGRIEEDVLSKLQYTKGSSADITKRKKSFADDWMGPEHRYDGSPNVNKRYDKLQDNFDKKFGDDKKLNKTVDMYSRKTTYKKVNTNLRAGQSMEEQNTVNFKATELQKAASTKLPAGTTLYRGVSPAAGAAILKNNEMKSQGFVSTSTSSSAAHVFASGGFVLEIKAKTGMPLKRHSKHPQEFEVLQAHGTKYRVTGFRQQKGGSGPHADNQNIIMMEEI